MLFFNQGNGIKGEKNDRREYCKSHVPLKVQGQLTVYIYWCRKQSDQSNQEIDYSSRTLRAIDTIILLSLPNIQSNCLKVNICLIDYKY